MNLASGSVYIAIEGVIGVGKTTLGRLLQPHFQADLLLEAFDENPFLSDFYGDRDRYAFQTQIFFLLSRYRQQQAITEHLKRKSLLSDYFFAKDQLFAHLTLQGDEWTMYERLYETLSETIAPPNLVVYLRAETDTLMARIAMRDRPYERQMDRAYIEALRQGYETLFASYSATPLLILDTDGLDFVRNAGDMEEVENRIRAALQGIRQPRLLTLAQETPPHFTWNLPADRPTEPTTEANWQALGDFIALTKAVGEVGGALVNRPPVTPQGAPEALQSALLETTRALQALAQRTGISLPLE